MSDLRELYQDTILDHSKHPKNYGKLEGATHHAEGYNPLCGDRVEVFVALDGERLKDIRFLGQGCAISTASASLMTETLKGKTLAEALALFEKLHDVVTGQEHHAKSGVVEPELGKLAVLEGVKQYPLRVKCATLAWHALKNAVTGKTEDVAITE
jgi:nitrogen fixation protein NifU and related proteins